MLTHNEKGWKPSFIGIKGLITWKITALGWNFDDVSGLKLSARFSKAELKF